MIICKQLLKLSYKKFMQYCIDKSKSTLTNCGKHRVLLQQWNETTNIYLFYLFYFKCGHHL